MTMYTAQTGADLNQPKSETYSVYAIRYDLQMQTRFQHYAEDQAKKQAGLEN